MKNLILALFLTLGMASSYANNNLTELKVNETKSEFALTSTVSSEMIYKTNDEDCKWYFVTKIHTVTHLCFGYAVWVEVHTETTLECR